MPGNVYRERPIRLSLSTEFWSALDALATKRGETVDELLAFLTERGFQELNLTSKNGGNGKKLRRF